MDRNRSSLGERPSQLIVKESGRKPLFASSIPRGSDRNKENDQSQQPNSRLRSSIQSNGFARSTTSDLDRRESVGSVGSRDSKLPTPRFSSSTRKRLSMSDAFAMAQKEAEDDSDGTQAVDASPSPAPRVWRQRHEDEGNQMRQALNHDHLDTKAPSRPFSRNSIASRIPELRRTPDKSESPRQRSFYGKSRAGLSFTPREPPRESNTPAPAPVNGVRADSSRPESRTGGQQTGSNWLRHMPSKDDLTKQGRIPALVPGIEDILPSIEGPESQNEPANSQPAGPASPEKSFAWQVDDDFTAGELQVSDSPRLRFGARPFANRIHFDEGSEIDINSRTRVAPPGARNTKLDEIRSREVKTGSDIPLEPQRPQNTKIDEIREREERVEHQIPIPDRNAPRPRNTKLDEIRQREVNGIPRRSIASIRLGEIREQNAMSRSRSPEEDRPKTSRGMIPETKTTTEIETKEPLRPKSAFEMAGERIPDTPVTIYKSRRESVESDPKEGSNSKDEADGARPGLSHTRTDSRDLLRRLARATSSSPAPEPEPRQLADTDKPASLPLDSKPDTASTIPQPSTSNGFRNRQHRSNRDFEPKPTVAFAGLSRNRSTESVKSKKSMEAGATDRIEAEASLFAAGDNQSEKGSVRAPSPEPDADDEKDLNATPRAPKPDPLTMPTPKVTGAYVETPATVRVEKVELKDRQEKPKREERPPRQRSASFRDTRSDRAMSGSDRDTASDPGTDDKPSTRTSSSGVRRRRTRSLPRRRGTLTNSAKLPTVKDDLKELQRAHHIEDSTLDDLEEVLLGRKAPSQEVEDLLDKLPQDTSADDDYDFDLELDTKLNTRTNQINPQTNDNSDLDRMTRMNNTLKSSLYGIHTAARGIERLSDQVNTKNKAAQSKAAENKSAELRAPKEEPLEKNLLDTIKPEPLPEKMSAIRDNHGTGTAFITHAEDKSVSYLSIPIPELYRRKPYFRFTLLGLIIFLVASWFALESSMCAMFCRPTRCGSTPCVWSIDDPTFGNAIPVKLDQWTTGGRGRVLAGQLKEEMDDWFADMMDVVLDRKITDVDIQGLSFEQKRQHRRRLRKKGLVKRRMETPEQRAKWEAWQRARQEQERQKELREMGYEIEEDDDGTIGGDTRVW